MTEIWTRNGIDLTRLISEKIGTMKVVGKIRLTMILEVDGVDSNEFDTE